MNGAVDGSTIPTHASRESTAKRAIGANQIKSMMVRDGETFHVDYG